MQGHGLLCVGLSVPFFLRVGCLRKVRCYPYGSTRKTPSLADSPPGCLLFYATIPFSFVDGRENLCELPVVSAHGRYVVT